MTKTTMTNAEREREIEKTRIELHRRAEENYTILCQSLKDWNYDESEIGNGMSLLGALCAEAGIEVDDVLCDLTSIEMEELVMRANRIGGYADEATRDEAVRRLFNRGLDVIYEPSNFNRITDLQTGEVVSAPFSDCLSIMWWWATYELHFRQIRPETLPETMNIKQVRTDEGGLAFNIDGLEYVIQFDPALPVLGPDSWNIG